MSVYGMTMRRRVVAALDDGLTVAATARRFGIDEKTVRSYRRRAAEGRLEADRSGPKGHVKLTDADVALLRAEVAERCDQTLAELRAKLSVTVAESTISRALGKQGLSLKKKSLIAAEQKRPDVAERRRNFSIARRFVPADSLVFLDESGAASHMTRRYGRSPVGSRCIDHTPHGHWQITTMLSAIRASGVIEQATIVTNQPMNAAIFAGYVEHCLAPSLKPGDVVVMDNLSSHKAAGIVEAIEAADASVWYLPAYSPDLNPIEKLWSKVKAWLRRHRPPDFDAIGRRLVEALRTVTPEECLNYFRSCGYGM